MEERKANEVNRGTRSLNFMAEWVELEQINYFRAKEEKSFRLPLKGCRGGGGGGGAINFRFDKTTARRRSVGRRGVANNVMAEL